MIHKFGNKQINANHVDAIDEPDYKRGGFAGFYVSIYFIGGKVDCEFEATEDEHVREIDPSSERKSYKHGLRLKDGSVNWNEGTQSYYYSSFTESLIYERMKNEIQELIKLIDLID